MTTFDRPTLGKLIRRQRELTALPLRQVAAAVGISNAYLSQIEREHSERVLGAIADQLGLSPDILIAEANPSPLASAGSGGRGQHRRYDPAERSPRARRPLQSTAQST